MILFAIPFACLLPATQALRPFIDLTLVVGLGMPLLCIAQAVEPPKPFRRLFIMGGRISYAIYILHWPFLEAARRLTWRDPGIAEMAPMLGLLTFVLFLPFAYFAERYYRPTGADTGSSRCSRAALRGAPGRSWRPRQ